MMTTTETAKRLKLVVIDSYGPHELCACPDCKDGRKRAEHYLLGGCDESPEILGMRLGSGLRHYPHQGEAIKRCLELVADARGWLTLSGSFGVGKSTLIWAVLNELRDVGLVGRYWTASRMLDHIRSGIGLMDGSGKSERDIVQRLISLPVLAVDELDKYNPTGYADNQIFTVLSERYRRWEEGVTLLAYNKAGDVHPALRSRIGDGRFHHIELRGPDLRPAQRRI